jgi:phosphoadenosine phosphosulfate reductase
VKIFFFMDLFDDSTELSRTDLYSKIEKATKVLTEAIEMYGDLLVMSTSFGIQSAVLLHLVSRIKTGVPAIWIDTGYLPPETYQYSLQLKNLLNLNVKVYQSELSPAHMESIYGRLWESPNEEDRRLYGILRKVIPMKQAQRDLNAKCILIGLRRSQTDHRSHLKSFEPSPSESDEPAKLHPLIDWSDEDIAQYFLIFGLPQHPLYYKGYTTVGDAHSSRPRAASDTSDRLTRFGGSGQQECGLHTESSPIRDLSEHALKRLSPIASSPPEAVPSPVAVSDITLEQMLESSSFVIYGKPNCKYCKAAKLLLGHRNHRFLDVTVTSEAALAEGGPTIYLSDLITKVRGAKRDAAFEVGTVPQIFFNGVYIGGYTELCTSLRLSEKDREAFLSNATIHSPS